MTGSAKQSKDSVIPGRCEASRPESRDSGSGPSDHPGMTKNGLLRRFAPRNDALAFVVVDFWVGMLTLCPSYDATGMAMVVDRFWDTTVAAQPQAARSIACAHGSMPHGVQCPQFPWSHWPRTLPTTHKT